MGQVAALPFLRAGMHGCTDAGTCWHTVMECGLHAAHGAPVPHLLLPVQLVELLTLPEHVISDTLGYARAGRVHFDIYVCP